MFVSQIVILLLCHTDFPLFNSKIIVFTEPSQLIEGTKLEIH